MNKPKSNLLAKIAYYYFLGLYKLLLLMRKGLVKVLNRKFAKKFVAASLIPLLIFTGGSLWFLFHPKAAKAVWFDDNWAFRKPISFTHNAAVYNTQVELDIDTTDSPDKFQADCGDVRFTDINGNLLRYFLDSAAGACDTASTDFDVLIPQIVNGTNVIYMYYGNPNASNGTEPNDFKEATTSPSGGAPSAGTEVKGPSPTLYWKFDEGGGTTAEDQTSNGFDGTLNNTPSRQTEDFCISGKCLYFDGTNNENVSLADPSSGSLDFTFTDNFTVQAWVKRNGASSANTVIINKASDNLGATYQGYKLYMDASGDFCFATRDGTLAEDSACTSAVDFDDDKWHHVAGTKLGRSVIRLYVDGYERASDTSIESTGSLANSGTFYTGVDSDGTSNEWLGFIDEVKVYRDETVRSATQIAADFNARSNNKGASVMYGPQLNNNPQALNNGLVGYWKEDETTNGAVATDSSGNATSLTDSATVVRAAGKFGRGGDFESTSSQYQFAADNAVLSITGSLTLAAWIKPETVSAGSYNIIAKWDGSNESYRLFQNGDEIRLELDSDANYIETSASNLAAATFYHVVGVYDSTSSTAKIYINGTEAATTTTGTIPSSIGDDAGRLHIGAEDSTTTAANFYDGVIDEARIYNRALTSAEVSQLYNFAPGPVLYYKMDEGSWNNNCSTDSAFDSSGNSNHGDACPASTGPVGAATGKYGKGGGFDGSNDYLISSSNVFNPSLTDFTAAIWFKVSAIGAGRNIYAQQDGSGTGRLWMGVTAAGVVQSFLGGVGTLGATTLSANTWYHAAVVKSGSTVSIYLNGVLDGSGTVTVESATGSQVIGSSKTASANFFLGTLDEARIYNYVRTPGQIIEDMNAGHPAPGSPVGSAVAYWKMDEGFGTTANDSNSQNGSENLSLSTASWTNSGKFGKAWNGTGALWLSRADDADFDFAAAEDFGISLWAKSDAAANPGTAEYLVDKGTTIGYSVYFNTSGQAVFSVTDGTNTDTATTTTDFYDNAWHNIVAIKTGTTKIELFVDGISRASDTSIAATGTLANADSLTVGDQDATDDGDEFFGDIDEVKIYRLALTTDQVKQEFNRGSAQVLGALSDNSTYQPNAANQEYCVPGDSSTCSAPVGEWKLEEKNGATANDTSGTGNNGTILGAKWTNGKIGSALQFDGTDDYINAGTATTLDDLGPMSFSFWMYPNLGQGSGEHLIAKRDGGCSGIWRLGIETTSNDLGFLKGGGGPSRITATNVFTSNAWNHIALTWDGTINQTGVKIYVNGSEVSYASGADGTTIVSDGGCNLYLASRAGTSSFFNGRIDEVEIFNYVRTPAQIAWDYNRGGPVGYWKFDECQGTSFFDSAGNSLTGTWNGAASGSQTAAGDCNSGNSAHAWNNGKTGKRNYSLNFDGTDDYVNVADNAVLDATTGLTLSIWFNKTALGTTKNILTKWSSAGGIGNQYSYNISTNTSNQLVFFIDNDGDPFSGNGCDITTTTTFSANTWYHIVATFNSDALKLYRDGIEQPTTLSGTCTSSIYQGTAPLNIGSVESGTTNFFDGKLDDARVYNYAMTANQVRILMNQGGALRYGPTLGAP